MFRSTSTGDTLELSDDEAGSAVTIVPGRGAIITRFRVGERELLYLDESTLRDPAKNVRGGIPLLFPSPGRLTGDRFERDGRSGSMKQHGFARDSRGCPALTTPPTRRGPPWCCDRTTRRGRCTRGTSR